MITTTPVFASVKLIIKMALFSMDVLVEDVNTKIKHCARHNDAIHQHVLQFSPATGTRVTSVSIDFLIQDRDKEAITAARTISSMFHARGRMSSSAGLRASVSPLAGTANEPRVASMMLKWPSNVFVHVGQWPSSKST